MALTIFYDDRCVICRTEMARFYSQYGHDMNLIALSTQADELEKHHIKLEDALTLMHIIDEQGQLYVGMDALRVMYQRFGKAYITFFTSLPLLRGLFDVAYPIFARHRYRFPAWLLLGIGVKDSPDLCQNGYCQLPSHDKAKLLQDQRNERK